MRGASFSRHLLFGAVSLVLLAVAFAIGSEGGSSPPSTSSPQASSEALALPPAARRITARLQRSLASARPPARRFLHAFFRYEVGEAGPRVAAALRASATPRFARQLLAAPPRPSPSGPTALPARLGALEVSVLSPDASRVLVSGKARRGPSPEQFSFVFVHVAGGWLASAPGQ
jgi:hypothetical protein